MDWQIKLNSSPRKFGLSHFTKNRFGTFDPNGYSGFNLLETYLAMKFSNLIQHNELLLCTISFMFIESCLVIIAASLGNTTAVFFTFFASGWLFWTFAEYTYQRFLLKDQNRCEWRENLPKNKLAIQGILVGILGSVILVLAFELKNSPFTFFSGFLIGYLLYTLFRFLVHRPEGKFILPRIQRAHILHHTRYPNRGFSFSTLFWDWLFDTLPPSHVQVTDQMRQKYFE